MREKHHLLKTHGICIGAMFQKENSFWKLTQEHNLSGFTRQREPDNRAESRPSNSSQPRNRSELEKYTLFPACEVGASPNTRARFTLTLQGVPYGPWLWDSVWTLSDIWVRFEADLWSQLLSIRSQWAGLSAALPVLPPHARKAVELPRTPARLS